MRSMYGSNVKPSLIIAILLGVTLILWFFPCYTLTNEYKDYLKENSFSYSQYQETIEVYNEVRPSVYNLIFGGEKVAEVNGYELEIDYDDSVLVNLRWIFGFHVIALILAAYIFKNEDVADLKVHKAILAGLLMICGIGFFSITGGSGHALFALLDIEMSSCRQALGMYGSYITYFACIILGMVCQKLD